MPSVERGRACVSGYARLPPELPRATCSSVFLQTRGCPCNSSFWGISPASPLSRGTSNLVLNYAGAPNHAPLQEIQVIPSVQLELPAATTTSKRPTRSIQTPIPCPPSGSDIAEAPS